MRSSRAPRTSCLANSHLSRLNSSGLVRRRRSTRRSHHHAAEMTLAGGRAPIPAEWDTSVRAQRRIRPRRLSRSHQPSNSHRDERFLLGGHRVSEDFKGIAVLVQPPAHPNGVPRSGVSRARVEGVRNPQPGVDLTSSGGVALSGANASVATLLRCLRQRMRRRARSGCGVRSRSVSGAWWAAGSSRSSGSLFR